MTVTCKTCGVNASLHSGEGLPLGWAVVEHDDYLDDFYCNNHAQVT